MLRTLSTISSLLLGIGLLLMGLALLSTSLGVRAVAEGYNDTITGLIMASYFGGFIVGSYLCPRLIRRIGPIRSYAALAAIGAVAAFLPTLLVHPLIWAILRFIIGTALVGLYMVLESWLNATTPNAKRGQVFGIYMIVTLLAHALGQFLLLFDPLAHTTAFGIAAVFFSLGLIPIALTRLPEPQSVPVPALHLRHLIQLSPLSVAGALTGGLATSSFWALGAVFANRIGLTGEHIVLFMAITIFGGVLLQWPIGRLSDHVDRRIVLTMVTILAAIAALIAALVYTRSLTWLYGMMFALGGLLFPIYSLSVAYLNDRVHADDALDASRGVLLTYGFGALFGPILAGAAMTLFGPIGLFYYLTFVLCGFVLFATLRIRASEPVPVEDRSNYLPMTRTSQAVLELDPRLELSSDLDTTEHVASIKQQ
jgi:MFS family permease